MRRKFDGVLRVPKAIWNGKVIAESDDTVVVEGNHYFHPGDVKDEYLIASEHTSYCPWKGTAHYHHVVIDGQESTNGAWHYPETKPKADSLRGRFAFWKGVEVTD